MSKDQPPKERRAEDVEEPEEESPKSKKGKGVLKTVISSFKRNREDKSSEASSPKKKSTPAPSLISQEQPQSILGSMGPPPTSSPSFSSFESAKERNYEAERLRILLNASQEDLRLQREHFIERERRQQESFDAERALYEARIEELQRRRGEGSGWSARG